MAPGLPNTRVIHPAFQRHHAPVAEGAMVALCFITRPATTPGTPIFDEVAGRSVYLQPLTVYVGPCRVQRSVIGARPELAGDREVVIREYIVSLPVSTPDVQVNDLLTVTACPDDPALVGQQMMVRDPRYGSIAWQRDLVCEAYPPVTR